MCIVNFFQIDFIVVVLAVHICCWRPWQVKEGLAERGGLRYCL